MSVNDWYGRLVLEMDWCKSDDVLQFFHDGTLTLYTKQWRGDRPDYRNARAQRLAFTGSHLYAGRSLVICNMAYEK